MFLFLAFFLATIAGASDDFEIQVYDNSINAPWQKSIEVHTNYTIEGRRTVEYSGEVPPDRVMRMTFEPAIGLTKALEFGMYVQTAFRPDGIFDLTGVKFRMKFILPPGEVDPYFLGINFEIADISQRYDQARWGIELRPIAGIATDRWLVSVNPNLEWGLAGGVGSGMPEFSPGAKVRYKVHKHIGVGTEYYGDLGPLNGILPLAKQKHAVFLAADLIGGPIEFNLGIGRGLTDATDAWTVKLIIGKSF